MKRRGNHCPEEQKGKWLLTFNDMATLLLTFFVLIISMSHIDAGKVKGISVSARETLGPTEATVKGESGVIEPFLLPFRDADIEKERAKVDSKGVAGGAQNIKEAFIRSLNRLKGVRVFPLKEGLSLSLEETLLFASGSADILGKARPLLKALGGIIHKADVLVRVEGNTDNLPIMTGQFPSNWELSTARAVAVVKYLSSEGGVAPGRLSVAGYADARPRVPNVNPYNRQLNRRVEIILTFP